MEKIKDTNKYFDTLQIDTFIGNIDENSNMIGERKKLIILHQCGEDKKSLIGQLKTMIHGIETNFDSFGV